jgi:hypothetical protein
VEIQEKKLKQASSEFHKACDNRLAKKELEGYTGWDGAHSSGDIINQMIEDINRVYLIPTEDDASRLVDISNRAMMLWHRITKSNESK